MINLVRGCVSFPRFPMTPTIHQSRGIRLWRIGGRTPLLPVTVRPDDLCFCGIFGMISDRWADEVLDEVFAPRAERRERELVMHRHSRFVCLSIHQASCLNATQAYLSSRQTELLA